MSLTEMFSLNEADVLKYNPELKDAVVNKIPKLQQMVMQNLKSDNYEQVVSALEQLEQAVRSAKSQLQATLQSQGGRLEKQSQPPVSRDSFSIKNDEI